MQKFRIYYHWRNQSIFLLLRLSHIFRTVFLFSFIYLRYTSVLLLILVNDKMNILNDSVSLSWFFQNITLFMIQWGWISYCSDKNFNIDKSFLVVTVPLLFYQTSYVAIGQYSGFKKFTNNLHSSGIFSKHQIVRMYRLYSKYPNNIWSAVIVKVSS